jgi:hypothetical protein
VRIKIGEGVDNASVVQVKPSEERNNLTEDGLKASVVRDMPSADENNVSLKLNNVSAVRLNAASGRRDGSRARHNPSSVRRFGREERVKVSLLAMSPRLRAIRTRFRRDKQSYIAIRSDRA